MEESHADDLPTRIIDALHDRASAAAIGELVRGLRQETIEERKQAQGVMDFAMGREADVRQVVLNAMRKEVIVPSDTCRERTALHVALTWGRKDVVMAVVERMRREALVDFHVSTVRALLRSHLAAGAELVDAVVSVLPLDAFGQSADRKEDALLIALCCSIDYRNRAVELCLQLGPSMEERLKGKERFRYVSTAAECCDLCMVQAMHELVPLLPDGSGRRGETEDYADALAACVNIRENPGYPIMEFLVEHGGSEVLERCKPHVLLDARTVEDAEWLVTRAPHLVAEACRLSNCLDSLIINAATAPFIIDQILKLDQPVLVVKLMQQPRYAARAGRESLEDGWRWRLEKLHKAVPECLDGLRWPWLMEAIDERAIKDVEYMAGLCMKEHLVMRNEEGDTAHEVAARCEDFPQELLNRLKVAVKGAHA